MKNIDVDLSKIENAKLVLDKILDPTPLLFNRWLSESLGCQVFLKLENVQPIGSFKIRGATYRISNLSKEEKKRGVVAASAGNHAQGVAWGAANFGVKATIVMPLGAPLTKLQNTKALGAEVVLFGNSYEEAFDHAMKISRKSKSIYIPAFEDSDVISGQGTVGLEILEQLPDADLVIGSLGGGGLMAGVGIAIKTKRPSIKTMGVQASGSRSLVESIKAGRVLTGLKAQTFADGIKVKSVKPVMLKILKNVLDQVGHADDEAIAASVLTLLEKAKIAVEGSGAVPLAVLSQLCRKNPKFYRNKKIVLIISGGNIDVNVLGRIIDRGLIMAGRRIRANVFIPDKPGSLNALTQLLAEQGANILQVIHDRGSSTTKLEETGVELTLETRSDKHSQAILEALKNQVRRVELI